MTFPIKPLLQILAAFLIGFCFSEGVSAVSPAISAGHYHSLFLKTDGTVWGAGDSSEGQVGAGVNGWNPTPVQILTNAKAISAGSGHSLFLKSDGTVWATGNNSGGSLGIGTTSYEYRPVQTPISGVQEIAAGAAHSLFLKTDGTVWAAGRNSSGQLGNGATLDRSSPVQVSITGVKSIAAGFDHSLFLKTDGTVWATGYNLNGELGDGSTVNRSTPVMIMSGVQAISGGQNHSLFLKTDGSAWATGKNSNGQLGDGGVTAFRSTPAQILTGVTMISAGFLNSFFLKADGNLWATGSNSYGGLGNGTNVSKVTPAVVVTGVQSIEGGRLHSLLIRTDGTMQSTGNNSSGQLGDRTTVDRFSPVLVLFPTAAFVTTPSASGILTTTASLGGNVESDGGSTISARGIVVSQSSTNNNPLQGGVGVVILAASGTTGVFTVSASGLIPETAYTFKAYATNGVGTTYSSSGTFTTVSINANLSSLALSSGTLSPAFSSATTSYSSDASNGTASLTVTATRAQSNATISVNGTPVASGIQSQSVPLTVGTNTITIAVTAQDGITVKNYTVTVTRAALPPTITTASITSVTSSGATLGGNVTNDNGFPITERGIVLSQTSVNGNPLIGGGGVYTVVATGTTGVFTINASGLIPGTAYAFNAYATNSAGTSYTSPVSNFTTLPSLPLVSNPTSSDIGATVATLGGNVTSDGGGTITGRGIVYSKTTLNNDPLLTGTNVIVVPVTGTTGIFTVNTTNLSPGTNYSFKAFATNSGGTAYSSPVSTFVTPVTLPTVTTPTSSTITTTTATLNGNVTSDGGAAISARGMVLSVTSANPDPLLGGTGVVNLTASGSTGAFTLDALNLTPTTEYTFKLYARNSAGTAYSPAVTFTTPSNNANLSNLTLSTGTLTPAFASATTSYSSNVSNGTASVTVTATRTQTDATITINGSAATSGTPSDPIGLIIGQNILTVVVTAQDGTTTRSYTVTITRAPYLPIVVLDVPPFHGLTSTGVSPDGVVTSDGGGTITARGVVISRTALNSNPTVGGTNVILVNTLGTTGALSAVVTGLVPATPYTFRLFATNSAGTGYSSSSSFTTPSNNANLSSLTLNGASFTPAFSPALLTYTGSVPNSTSSVTVTATRAQSNATITVNGQPVSSGVASPTISLSVGQNVILIVVTAQDGITKRTYSITLNRAAGAPIVTSPVFAKINDDLVSMGGTVVSDGGAAVTSRGVVYSASSDNGNPALGGTGVVNLTASGSTGSFSLNQTGLVPGTAYVFKAYAVNSAGTGYSDLSNFTLPAPPPVITSSRTSGGTVNKLFSYQITATRNPTSFGAVNLPSGLSINPSTGLISGYPVVDGTFNITLQALNGGGVGQVPLELKVEPVLPRPVITSPPFAAAVVNTQFSFTLMASNSATTFEIRNGPTWLGVNATTGALTGLPVAPGSVTVEVRAGNSTGLGNWALLSISVSPDPNAPVITSLSEARGRYGEAFAFQLTSSPLATSYTAAGPLPAGITLSSTSGLLSGTPSVEGTYSISTTGTNSFGPGAPSTLKIILGPPLQVPVITTTTITLTAGFSFTASVQANFSPLSFTFANLPAGVTQSGTTGSFSGQISAAGSYTILASATNATGTGPKQNVLLQVQANTNSPGVMPNPLDFPGQGPVGPTPNGPGGLPLIPQIPPVIIAPPDYINVDPDGSGIVWISSGQIGVPFVYEVLVDKPATLFTASGLPPGLSISASTGVIGGTPTEAAYFIVTLQASNALGSQAPLRGAIYIRSNQQAPVISGSLQEVTTVLSPFSYQIQATSIQSITGFGASGLPDGLRVDAATGVISGTPTATGIFEIQIRASNASGSGNPKTLYLLVKAGSLTPKITSQPSLIVQQGSAASYQIIATPSPILAYQAVGLPDGLSLNSSTGVISGRPIYAGIQTVGLRASNVNGTGDLTNLEIQVTPNAAVPRMLVPDSFQFSNGQPFEVTLQATGLPATKPWPAGYGIFAEALPAGMALNSSTGLLSGFPSNATGWNDQEILIYGVNDSGRGASSRVSLQTYASPPSAPLLVSPKQLSAVSGAPLLFAIQSTPAADFYGFAYFTDGNSITTANQPSPNFSIMPPLPGRYSYSLRARGADWGILSGLPLSVAPAPGTPVLQTPSVIYATAGSSVNARVDATGAPTRFEITSVSPFWPSGLAFNESTGAFGGSVAQAGVITFLARGYNANGAGLPKEITLVFAPSSEAPVITDGGALVFTNAMLLSTGGTNTSLAPVVGVANIVAPVTGKVGVDFFHKFQTTGGAVGFRVAGLPEGLAFNGNTGIVSGRPVAPGTSVVTVAPYGNTVGGQPVQVTLLIAPVDGTPTLTGPTDASATAGNAFSLQFSASGNPLGYNLSGLPDWAHWDPVLGTLTGTPKRPATTTLTASAFNISGQGASREYVIHVAAAAGTPVIAPPAGPITGQAGAALNGSIFAPGTILSYDAGTLPFGISLNSQTGAFSGLPVEPGIYQVPVWGVNSVGQGESITVNISISPASGTPVLTGDGIVRLVANIPFTYTFAASPTATSWAADGLPGGWLFNSQDGTLQATPLAGIYDLILESWNAAGSSGKRAVQIRVFSTAGGSWNDEQFGADAGNPLISGWTADPDNDGLVNLLERAFNLNPNQPTLPILVTGTGTTGLPNIRSTGTGASRHLKIEYLRRKASTNPGLTYTPQFLSDLGATWQDFTGSETVQSIDTEWERVAVEDSATGEPKRFGRVKVVSGP